jgi:hypothetical protein
VAERSVPLGELYDASLFFFFCSLAMSSRMFETIFAYASILLLLVSLHFAKGDIVFQDEGFDFHVATGPYIKSPDNSAYTSGLLGLYVSFHAAIFGNVGFSMNYSLDDKENVTLTLVQHYFGFFKQTGGHPEQNYLDGFVELPILCNGSHSITVYLKCDWETGDAAGSHMHTSYDSQSIHFTVLSPIALLMQNNYNSTEIPLVFYVNGTYSQVVYDLDNQHSVTIAGNSTLTGLNEGTHSINIYSLDDKEHLAGFDTATFRVIKVTNSPSSILPTPNCLLLVLLTSIVILAVSLLWFFGIRRVRSRWPIFSCIFENS